jgi:hypothetical protein
MINLIIGGIILILVLLVLFYIVMFRLVLRDFNYEVDHNMELLNEIIELEHNIATTPPIIKYIKPNIIEIGSSVEISHILNEEHREQVAKGIYYGIAEELWHKRLVKTEINQKENQYQIKGNIKIVIDEENN